MKTINDAELILGDFIDIWFTNCDARYRVLKGGRSTGKSYDFIGLEPIFKILSDKRRNLVFARQNYKDNGSSTYPQIKQCIYKLGIQHLFAFNTSPLRITLKHTGQMILFGGMNDVDNLLSTTFPIGYWTDLYLEEASQLKSYEDFRRVDGSMRIPNYEDNLKVQITFLMNAWDVGHWTYEVFFKGRLEDDISRLESERYQFYTDDYFNLGADSSGIALHISSFRCNKYNSEQKMKNALELKEKSYNLYLVEQLGCWGNTQDAVYPEWSDSLIKTREYVAKKEYSMFSVGVDFGISNGEGKILKGEDVKIGSATSMELVGVDKTYNKLTFINEYYWSNETQAEKKTGPAIQDELITTLIDWLDLYSRNYTLMKGKVIVYVDCADSGGFRQGLELEARRRGFYSFVFMPSTKIKIQTRVDFLRRLMAFGDVEFGEDCKNLIRETKNARRGKKGECREDTDDHSITASEYAWIPLKDRLVHWKTFKPRD